MVTLETTRLGNISYKPEEVITFSSGVPGFPACKRYVRVQPDAAYPFYVLQSVEEGEVGFLLTNPFIFYSDYTFELDEGSKQELNMSEEDQIEVYSIVTLGESLEQSTLNLLAPVVFNPSSGRGKQLILHGTAYKAKHMLQREGLINQTAAGKE